MSEPTPKLLDDLHAQIVQRVWVGAVLLVLLCFWAHAPSLQNGYIWDDDQYVTDNVQLRTLSGLYRIWTDPRATPQYYPLVHTTFWVEYQLWGLAPFHFHFFNVLLHALGTILLWRCFCALAIPGAFVAACVFALHPVQVESVAWVTERKNVLCGVFYFASALVLLEVLLAQAQPARRLQLYFAGVVLFVLAMLSKTVACSLGAVLLLLVWWKTGTIRKRDVAWVAPLLAIGAGLGLTTAWLEREHVGARGAEWAFSFADRCIIAGRSLAFYLRSLLWPGERMFIPPRWPIDDRDPVQYLYPLGVLVTIAALFALRRRLGRGLLVAALIYAGVLLPALGFFNIYPMRYAFAFDHFQYLAMPAPIALATAAAAGALAGSRVRVQALATLAVAVLLASYGVLTWQQSHVYFGPETLWRHTITHNPDAWLAYRHLGKIELDKGNAAESARLFGEAIRVKPTDESAYNNLAFAYSHLGRFDDAVLAVQQSIRLRPGYAPSYRNLSVALSLAGRNAEARAALAQFKRMTGKAPGAQASSSRP